MAIHIRRRRRAHALVSMASERRRDRERRAGRLTPLEGGAPQRLAGGLGWFSLGLGLGGALAPRAMARVIGVGDTTTSRTVLRLVGLREIACGLGILSRARPVGWLWGRVAGDVVDLALLGAASRARRTRGGRVAAATAAVVGVTALDAWCGRQLGRRDGTTAGAAAHGAVAVRKSVTVNRGPEELYRLWRDFTNLPRFMQALESVKATGERRSHWRARGPAGMVVEGDAEVIDDRPDELIAWRSLPGSRIAHSGVVRFRRAPGGRGTEVTVEMEYTPPGGAVTAALAKLTGRAPEQQLREDLRRFKQVVETGDIVRAGGRP